MALTGASVGNTCYSSLPLAQDAYFQQIAPVIQGTTTYSYQNIAGVWRFVTTKNAIVTSIPAPLPALPVCDPMLGFVDGLQLAGLLTVALVVAVMAGIVSRAK